MLPEARLHEAVFPNYTNHLGTLFGGQVLAWMDKAAFIVASRHARTQIVVTGRTERVDFRHPVRLGQWVELVARIVEVGRSSMQIDVDMLAEDLHTGVQQVCASGRFVMIALDEHGKAAQVPPLPA